MPFLGELTLEFCDQATPGASREDVERALAVTPRSPRDWFLTLTRANDEYVDVTLDDDGSFFIQCEEDGKKWVCESPLTEELVATLVLAFYEHERDWRSRTAWRELKRKRGLLDFLDGGRSRRPR